MMCSAGCTLLMTAYESFIGKTLNLKWSLTQSARHQIKSSDLLSKHKKTQTRLVAAASMAEDELHGEFYISLLAVIEWKVKLLSGAKLLSFQCWLCTS